MTTSATTTVLEVDRADHGRTRLFETEDPPLEEGQVRLRVDRFAVTANNITYAAMGDAFGYWDFFPAEKGWGRVPAMGWADLVESRHPDVAVGGRYYGWYPMADQVTMTVSSSNHGFRDDGPNRQAHAPVYRAFLDTRLDPLYEPGTDGEDRHALLRGLFITGFAAEEFFAANRYFDADQVIVLSASSKTAVGFAHCAAGRGAARLVGVTSAGNAGFVSSLGLYDSVVAYDRLDTVAPVPSVAIDMAGNTTVLAAVHQHLSDRLHYSMTVGMSHHDAPPARVEAGPKPELFFAPTEIGRMMSEWGRDEYGRRTGAALFSFIDHSRSWLSVEHRFGPQAARRTWSEVRDGRVPPDEGRIAGLHPTTTG